MSVLIRGTEKVLAALPTKGSNALKKFIVGTFAEELQRAVCTMFEENVCAKNLRAAMDVQVWQTQGFISCVLRGAILNKTARPFDKNDFVANHAIFFVERIRERGFFIKHVRNLTQMFFTETGLHIETPYWVVRYSSLVIRGPSND